MAISEKTQQTELSSRTTAFFSWIEFLGFAIFITTRFVLRNQVWLQVLSLAMIASGYLYKTYADWKAGRRKNFRLRIIFFIVGIILAVVLGYRAGQKRTSATPNPTARLQSGPGARGYFKHPTPA